MSTKRLRSVIHSTAHHAMNGLCHVHPHLGTVCARLSIKCIRIDLLESNFEPYLGVISKELLLSTSALCGRFLEILASENINPTVISKAYATFDFLQGQWPASCFVSVLDSKGTLFEAAVDLNGNPAEVLITNENIRIVR